MNNLSQISFFADEVSPTLKKYTDRNDVRTGVSKPWLNTEFLLS